MMSKTDINISTKCTTATAVGYVTYMSLSCVIYSIGVSSRINHLSPGSQYCRVVSWWSDRCNGWLTY